MRPSVAIATITLARTAAEQQRLRASLTALAELGPQIFVTDGGSSDEFQSWLSTIPQITRLAPARGLVPQVRRSVLAGADAADSVFYTEPDKLEFFAEHLPGLLALGQDPADRPDLLLACRDDAAFTTFPTGQQIVERSFNSMAGDLLAAEPTDVLYGPMWMSRDLAYELDRCPDDAGWGWRIQMYAQARLQGRTVKAHWGPFVCPPEQRGEDDPASRSYRLRQLVQNVAALERALAGAQNALR